MTKDDNSPRRERRGSNKDTATSDQRAHRMAANDGQVTHAQGAKETSNSDSLLHSSHEGWSLPTPSPALARLPQHLVRLVLVIAGERSDLSHIIDDFHRTEKWLKTSAKEASTDETAAVRRLIDLLAAEIAMTAPESAEQLAAKDIAIGGYLPHQLVHASLVKMLRAALDEDVRRIRVNRSLPMVLTDLLKVAKRKK